MEKCCCNTVCVFFFETKFRLFSKYPFIFFTAAIIERLVWVFLP